MEIKDSGKRQDFETGSVRDSGEGKGAYELLPTRALKRLAVHFENGAKKYQSRNWEKGQPLSRFLQSGLRHAFNYLEGDRSEDHAIAAVWNFMCLVETEERIKRGLLPKNLDDLSDIPSASEFFVVVNKLAESATNKEYCFDTQPINEWYYLPTGVNIEKGDEQLVYDEEKDWDWKPVPDHLINQLVSTPGTMRRRTPIN